MTRSLGRLPEARSIVQTVTALEPRRPASQVGVERAVRVGQLIRMSRRRRGREVGFVEDLRDLLRGEAWNEQHAQAEDVDGDGHTKVTKLSVLLLVTLVVRAL